MLDFLLKYRWSLILFIAVITILVAPYAAQLKPNNSAESFAIIDDPYIEIEFEDTVLIDTPAWIAHLIVPLGFALVAYRFAVSIAWQIYRFATGDESEGVQ